MSLSPNVQQFGQAHFELEPKLKRFKIVLYPFHLSLEP